MDSHLIVAYWLCWQILCKYKIEGCALKLVPIFSHAKGVPYGGCMNVVAPTPSFRKNLLFWTKIMYFSLYIVHRGVGQNYFLYYILSTFFSNSPPPP